MLQRQHVTVLEARPGALEARVGPAVLEPHGRSQVALEGPGRPTGLVAQTQGTQRGAERIGKDDIVREVSYLLPMHASCFSNQMYGRRADVCV